MLDLLTDGLFSLDEVSMFTAKSILTPEVQEKVNLSIDTYKAAPSIPVQSIE